jgi:hypothetical protein
MTSVTCKSAQNTLKYLQYGIINETKSILKPEKQPYKKAPWLVLESLKYFPDLFGSKLSKK